MNKDYEFENNIVIIARILDNVSSEWSLEIYDKQATQVR